MRKIKERKYFTLGVLAGDTAAKAGALEVLTISTGGKEAEREAGDGEKVGELHCCVGVDVLQMM